MTITSVAPSAHCPSNTQLAKSLSPSGLQTLQHTTTRTLAIRTAAAMAAAGLLLAATACSSAGDAATPDTTVAPTSTVAPSSSVPSSTSVPPTSSAPPTTSETGAAREALLRGVLDSHHTAGEFVGARIALLDRDGTITEVAAGTPTVDPASGPVDPDVAWNIGSATKIFVAVVALQLAEEGRIDLDAGDRKSVV